MQASVFSELHTKNSRLNTFANGSIHKPLPKGCRQGDRRRRKLLELLADSDNVVRVPHWEVVPNIRIDLMVNQKVGRWLDCPPALLFHRHRRHRPEPFRRRTLTYGTFRQCRRRSALCRPDGVYDQLSILQMQSSQKKEGRQVAILLSRKESYS